jgi:uncharacterized iron-regulated membrane protein
MMLLGAVSTLVIALLMAATLSMLLLTGRVWWRGRPLRRRGPGHDDALRRHPAGRGMEYQRSAIGPDDDPEFISSLEWMIRGGDGDNEP